MHYMFHWIQAASEARNAAEPHSITYVDFLTVTLTALCVLLAALGFIVAILAVLGYRDIKASAKQAAEAAIEAKLKQYPNATELHARFGAMDRYMSEMLRKERLLSQVRGGSSEVANAPKRSEDSTVKRPSRYPRKETDRS